MTALLYSRYKHGETLMQFTFGQEKFCTERGCVESSHRVMTYMDDHVDPCHSLYDFACGKWHQQTQMPAGKSKLSSFIQVAEDNISILKRILDNLDIGNEDSSAMQKVFKYYHACENTELIEKTSNNSLIELIDWVGGWAVTNYSSWNGEQWNFDQALTRIHHLKSMPLFYMYIAPDDKNSTNNIIQIEQSGITLPDESYYRAPHDSKIVTAYKKLLVDTGVLLGAGREDTLRQMEEVFDFEVKLAAIYEAKDDNLDKGYHRISLGHLMSVCPAIPWMDYMNNMFRAAVSAEEEIIVYNLGFLKNMSNLVIETDRRIIANYMVWHMIKPMLVMMSEPFRDVAMTMNNAETGGKATGISKNQCIVKTDGVLGFATGHLFVEQIEKHSSDIKEEVEKLLSIMKKAFLSNIAHVDWMDKETKRRATDKARSIVDMVGYPDWIKDKARLDEYYDDLTVTNDPLKNYLNAREFYHKRTMQRRGRKVVKNEWHMTPTEVNAYYSAPNNYIAFPVGILQPPFFHADYPMSMNFGAIGSVIGHELTHGFDSHGRNFDKYGNMVTWWSNASTIGFLNNSRCLQERYAAFDRNPGDPEDTERQKDNFKNLAENIADNGGLKIAYQAYKSYEKLSGGDKLLPGLKLSHEQMFYVGFAQVWCSMSRAERASQTNLLSEHSLEKLRVDVSASNSDSYSKAFKCKEGDRMNTAKKCAVW